MPKLLLLLTSAGSRLPMVASIAAHCAIAAAVMGARGGSAATSRLDDVTIDVETMPLADVAEVPAPHEGVPFATVRSTAPTQHLSSSPRPARHADGPQAAPENEESRLAVSPPVVAEQAALPRFSMAIGFPQSPSPATAHAGAVATSRGDSEDVADTGGISIAARLLDGGRPEYPSEARAEGLEADVTLEILVDTSGRVIQSRILRGAGHGFDESAQAAIASYRFAPAQREGSPTRVRMPWTVSFRLE